MAKQGWDNERIKESVDRIFGYQNGAWTELLRFMRDSYEARLEYAGLEVSQRDAEIERWKAIVEERDFLIQRLKEQIKEK